MKVKSYNHTQTRLAFQPLVTITSNEAIDTLVLATLTKGFEAYGALNVSYISGHPSAYQVRINMVDEQEVMDYYRIEIDTSEMTIHGTRQSVFYAAMQLEIYLSKHELYMGCIEDWPDLNTRGYYFDITRGRVPTLESLKELVDDIVSVRGNQLQLYIEHSFLYQAYPEMSAGWDGLSALDIKKLDDYCHERYVELVPSIASFGHLYHALKLPQHQEFCELDNDEDVEFSWIDRMNHHTVNVSNEASINFIDTLLRPFMGLFRSNKFNICADETFDLGKGKAKGLVATQGEGAVYLDFLLKVMNILAKDNYQVMFWGDILLKFPEEIHRLPKNVICLNWLYAKEPDEEKVKCFSNLEVEQILCPAVWGWNRMINNYDIAVGNVSTMVDFAVKHQTEGVLVTDWGDYGHINDPIFSKGLRHYSLLKAWNNATTLEEASLTAYGQEDTISKLHALSKCHAITWLEITWWCEHVFGNTRGNERYLSIAMERINAVTAEEINRKYMEMTSIISTLMKDNLNKVFKERLMLAMNGIRLFNELALHIKNGQTNSLLADEWLWWFDQYQKAWLTEHRYSELSRIKDAVRNISCYLRRHD